MAPKITLKKNYILIEPAEGIDFREIQQGIARLFYVDGIPEQNRVWVFREGRLNISQDKMCRLKELIKENFPRNARINKTAIVVESDRQTSLAESFAEIAADLPQKFKVFSNISDAEEWIKES
jgi:hypothetical protein